MLDLSKEKLNLADAIMANSVIKYRAQVNRVILCCYILIFILDVFHFHNYDFDKISSLDIANDSNCQTQVSRSEFECIIHLNFLNLQTAITNFSNHFTVLKPNLIFYSVSKNKNKLSSLRLSNNFLRAPPKLSYLT
ncbi:MAG: hypothetical protein WBQ32_08470 [Ignavibacteriaceae bacterium]